MGEGGAESGRRVGGTQGYVDDCEMNAKTHHVFREGIEIGASAVRRRLKTTVGLPGSVLH